MIMSKRYTLGVVSEIPFGEGRNFVVAGQEIAVFRTRADALYATQASCPHRQGPLADGLVGGTTLVCPLHEWSFDLKSGQPLNGTCALTVYAVSRGEGDQLLLDLPAEPMLDATQLGIDAEE